MAINTPNTLIKYCPTVTGKQILESRTLRWSSPHLFRDPFELTHESQLNFEPQVLLDATIKMATAMIFARDNPKGNTPLATAIRRWRGEERFASPDEAYDVLKELLGRVVEQRLQTIEELMTSWRKYARTLRICSFSNRADNLTAWQRFADNHQGIAIRFQVDEYSSFKNLHKVEYRSTQPEITSLRDEIAAVLGNKPQATEVNFENQFTVKPPHCAGEEEWRSFHSVEETLDNPPRPDAEWFDDRPFERSEVAAIYLGAMTPTASRRELLALIREHYSQAKVFQSRVVPGKYNLEFERLTKPSGGR